MCGIAGILSINNDSGNHLGNLIGMVESMHTRGPDDEGYFLVNEKQETRNFLGQNSSKESRSYFHEYAYVNTALRAESVLAMGHRRLSILDTSAHGHQPMQDASGRYSISFNGEIYNFKEIKKELESLGYVFRSNADTEVILAAYSEFKENAIDKFNGDFAISIWDNIDQCLFCARDRIGIKPFYYIIDDGKFVFASDIKTLIASGLFRPQPDNEGLYLAMSFGIAPRPITAFKGVKALEQGHWMRIYRNGLIEKSCYWRIPLGLQDSRMSENEAIELLESHLQRAVSLRLVADVPVGTFMSGGVDSTLISSIAAQQHPGIKAFTLGYMDDAPELDEVDQAQATAQMYDIEHIVKRVDPTQSFQDLTQWIRGYEEPFYSLAANYEISKLAKESGVTVVLNGLGGDELFAGYGWYKYHGFPHTKWLHLLSKRMNWLPSSKLRKVSSLLGARSVDRIHTIITGIANDSELCKLLNPSLCPTLEISDIVHSLYANNVTFFDSLEAMSYMDMMNYIGNHHVHRVDQFTMAHSIEGRFPFLDHELVEAAYRIPSHLKIRKKQHKYILRRVAEKYIAPECLSMKKKGFTLPLAQWMHGPLKELVDCSLDKLSQRPEIQSDTVRKWHNEYIHGSLSPYRIWHLVSLELWFEQFIDPGRKNISAYT